MESNLLLCIDDTDKIKFWGTKGSDAASYVYIELKACDPTERKSCNTDQSKTVDYINKMNMGLTMFYNKNQYTPSEYGKVPIDRSLQVKF